ncbi:hypothetical protein CKO28_00045 [Rhodovibrio sodomensis]|uniref:Uncharacterized protein n=1 Tax=Rhodovibrio sodomensis TaxID=1088 RepID=A0ABS1D7M3_9PROT|nr:hypothetical protein [Rhodovibrio sodomensis]MBK1666429.1 hypothetical protein [Rhodovibrio sodomensis]
MIDAEFTDWRKTFEQLCASAQIPVPSVSAMEHMWDDGLEPEEAAQAGRVALYDRRITPKTDARSLSGYQPAD